MNGPHPIAATAPVDTPSGITRIIDPAVLAGWASDASGKRGAMPLALVRPARIEDVEAIAAWANQQRVPLIPVSSPHGPRRHGDTVSERPAVLVDMSGMRKVLHVDPAERIAIIEPGLTFADFDAALRPHQLRSLKPLLPRAGKSVLASYLEREAITTPFDHWDSIDPIAATELVFGSGERFRTGGAAIPGTLAEQLANGNRHLAASGPFSTEFSRVLQGAQGSLGIVCWASVYCERLPALERPLLVGCDRLEPLTDLAYKQCWRRAQGQLFIVNGPQLALMMAPDRMAFESLCKRLPAWVLYANLTAGAYLPDERMAYIAADFESDAAALGLQPADSVGGLSAQAVQRAVHQPAAGDYRAAPLGDCAGLGFVAQMDRAPRLLAAAQQGMAGTGAGTAPMCVHLQPRVQGVSCQFDITWPASSAGAVGARAALSSVAARVADAGGFLSRPAAPWGRIAFERDPQAARYLAEVKNLFDPNRIMNPGQLCFAA